MAQDKNIVMLGGVVSIFIRNILKDQPIRIFGDGTQQRSFTYVKDVVKANLLAATTPISNGQIYNCASGIKVTIEELFQEISKIMGVKDYPHQYEDWLPGDIRAFDIDNSKIRNELGIRFLTNFVEGLKLTVDWGINYFKINS